MYPFTKLIILFAGWIIWCVIMGGLVWTPKLSQISQKYTCPIIVMLRGFVFSIFAFLSLFLLDASVKILFFGQLDYSNIGYNLFPVIIAIVSSLIIIFGSIFVAPTRKTLLGFIFLVIVFGMNFWNPALANSNDFGEFYKPLVYFLIFEIAINLIYSIIQAITKISKFEDTLLWDISEKFKQFFTPKLIFIFWFLFVIEIFLLFGGYSILAFGPGSDTLYQILIDLGIISGFVLWYVINRKIHKNKKKF